MAPAPTSLPSPQLGCSSVYLDARGMFLGDSRSRFKGSFKRARIDMVLRWAGVLVSSHKWGLSGF